MSAIHLHANHLGAIVGSYARRLAERGLDPVGPGERYRQYMWVYNCLAEQNARSVNWRYSTSSLLDDGHVLPRGHFGGNINEWFGWPLSKAALVKAIDSYAYQACETRDYASTAAANIVRTMLEGLDADRVRATDAYESADWTITAGPKETT